jgi:DNA polymerase-3 subunit delta
VAKSEGPTYDELLGALAKKDFKPVYLFYGEESFLIEEATDAVINAALTKDGRGFNLDIVYGSEADAKDVVSHASSFPMMAERRVVIVRDVDKLSNAELLVNYIENPSPSTCFVMTCAKPDMRKKLFAQAKKNGMAIEFKPLWEKQIPSWIARRAKNDKRAILPHAAEMLAAYVGTSLREICNELEKLYIYIGDRKTIEVDDVTAVVGISKEFSIFELQWAIGAKDTQKATEIMERMIDAGESPIMMVVMLNKFFQNLWKLGDLRKRNVPQNLYAQQTGIWSYMDKYLQALARFSSSQIEDAFLLLADVDEKLKSTQTDEKLLMQTLIVHLTDARHSLAA